MSSATTALIGLIALLAIVAGGVWGLQTGGAAANLVTILITTGAGYGVARYQDRAHYQRELEAKLVSDKRLLYKYYLDILKSILGPENTAPAIAEAAPKMRSFFFNAMLNASDDVIRAQNKFLRLTPADNEERLTLPAIADVILAMRRDAGLDTSLGTIDIMRPLINDLDENLEPFEEWERQRAGTRGSH
jgi:hypothetical protein